MECTENVLIGKGNKGMINYYDKPQLLSKQVTKISENKLLLPLLGTIVMTMISFMPILGMYMYNLCQHSLNVYFPIHKLALRQTSFDYKFVIVWSINMAALRYLLIGQSINWLLCAVC